MFAGAHKLAAGLYLLTLGIGGVLLAQHAWNSVTSYNSEYAVHESLPGGPRIARRVALVVLDGVAYDASLRMPALQSLARRGSSGVALVALPSLSNPGRATLSTGALPEVHGVTNNGRYAPPPVDSIFSLARQAAVPIAVFGGGFWPHAFGSYLGDNVHTFEKELGPSPSPERLIQWQSETCRDMVRFLESRPDGLLVAGITATDEAGHDFGGASAAYLDVVAEADRCLAALVAALDDGETTFVVTADHGHIDRRGQGGHGGGEPEVRRVPLVLAGAGVAPGRIDAATHLDAAPTIAALLGLPLPANNQGRILMGSLAVSADLKRELLERQEQQRLLLAQRLPDRSEGMAAEKRGRTPLAVIAALWFLATLAFAARGASPVRLTVAIAGYFACYFALFRVFGLGYSLSVVVREEYLNAFFLRDILAAAAATALSALVYRGNVLRTAVAVVAFIGLRVAWVWFDAGLVMRAYMLDLDQAFMAYLDLLQIFAVAATACLWAAVAAWSTRRRASSTP